MNPVTVSDHEEKRGRTLQAVEKITFVGVGAIGMPMAQQLAGSGWSVTAVDPSPVQRGKAEQAGMRTETVPTSAAEADAVVVMVATPEQLAEAALGNGDSQPGLLNRMRPGSQLVVMSTVGPRVVEELAVPAAERGVGLVDAPVTGGIKRAAEGALRLFVSGEVAARNRVRDVLEAMGSVIECGEAVGRGQSYKAVNQLLCAVHIVAGAEALSLAEKLGLDPSEVLQAVSGGAAASFMLADRGPRMLEGPDAEVASAVGIFVKDSTLVREIAEHAGHSTPLLEAAQRKYLEAAEAGYVNADDSQVIQTYR